MFGKHVLERDRVVRRSKGLELLFILRDIAFVSLDLVFDGCGFVFEKTVLGLGSPLTK